MELVEHMVVDYKFQVANQSSLLNPYVFLVPYMLSFPSQCLDNHDQQSLMVVLFVFRSLT